MKRLDIFTNPKTGEQKCCLISPNNKICKLSKCAPQREPLKALRANVITAPTKEPKDKNPGDVIHNKPESSNVNCVMERMKTMRNWILEGMCEKFVHLPPKASPPVNIKELPRRKSVEEMVNFYENMTHRKSSVPASTSMRKMSLVDIAQAQVSGHFLDTWCENLKGYKEYFEDNFKYVIIIEHSVTIDKQDLAEVWNIEERIAIIEVMIHLQQSFGLSESTVLCAVRMLDFLIVTQTSFPHKIQEIIGITCLWICYKCFETDAITAIDLVKMSNRNISPEEIIRMERNILTKLQFKINIPDPLVFLYYYLEKYNIHNNRGIRYSAMFFLEMFMYLLDFTCTAPSLLAAAAAALALSKNNVDAEPFIKFVEKFSLNARTFKYYCNQIWWFLLTSIKEHSYGQQLIEKYSEERRENVARFLLQC